MPTPRVTHEINLDGDPEAGAVRSPGTHARFPI
jgi:hypothetical protein